MTDNPGQELELVIDAEPPELIAPGRNPEGEPGDFVLELPSGHVLRLAHAQPGTIVEVASWTGPGRPDAETRRVMVGLGYEAPEVTGAMGGDVPAQAITQPSDQVVFENSPRSPRRLAKTAVWLVSSAAIVVGLWFSPLTVVRPTVGSSVGLGSTDAALVVVLPTDRVVAGQNVVAYLNPTHTAAVLGRVNQVSGDAVLVQTDKAFAQTSADRVAGRVLVVIPFVGALAR